MPRISRNTLFGSLRLWLGLLTALTTADGAEAQRRTDRFAMPYSAVGESASTPLSVQIVELGGLGRTHALEGALIGGSVGALGGTVVASFVCVMLVTSDLSLPCRTTDFIQVVAIGTGIGAGAGLLIGLLIDRDPDPNRAPPGGA